MPDFKPWSCLLDNRDLHHARFRWKLRLSQVTGDTAYGTVENIAALEQEHIRAYVPLPDKENFCINCCTEILYCFN